MDGWTAERLNGGAVWPMVVVAVVVMVNGNGKDEVKNIM